jgi:hypothetical protein
MLTINFSFRIGAFGSFLEDFYAPDFRWRIGPNSLIQQADSNPLGIVHQALS